MTHTTGTPDGEGLYEDDQWTVCTVCGAVVALAALHAAWHTGPADPDPVEE